MADAPPEAGPNLRLFLDATILIKAAGHPRLPYEVVQLAVRQEARLVLSKLVIRSARHHVARLYPNQVPLLERFLRESSYEPISDPPGELIAAHRTLCRDESDVPVALAAIAAQVDYLVTTDRDLTVVDATTAELRQFIRVITPLALLRHVLQWSEPRIETAIHRNWNELPSDG